MAWPAASRFSSDKPDHADAQQDPSPGSSVIRGAYRLTVDWRLTEYPAKSPRSLLWLGGHLYDVSRGWRRVDGTDERDVNWAPFGEFDSALVSPSGDLAALVDTDGTKALLLEPRGHVVRELNRSWYCADAYRYPLALFTLPDGRTGVVHCPEHYNQIEIEVAATGERGLGPLTMGRWSVAEERYLWTRSAPDDLGDLVPIDGGFLALNGHPRLFNGLTGELVAEWPDLTIPATQGSLLLQGRVQGGSGAVAVDATAGRFAVIQDDRVVVVDCGPGQRSRRG